MDPADAALRIEPGCVSVEAGKDARRADEGDVAGKGEPARPSAGSRERDEALAFTHAQLTVTAVGDPQPPAAQARGVRASEPAHDRRAARPREHDAAPVDGEIGVPRCQRT